MDNKIYEFELILLNIGLIVLKIFISFKIMSFVCICEGVYARERPENGAGFPVGRTTGDDLMWMLGMS